MEIRSFFLFHAHLSLSLALRAKKGRPFRYGCFLDRGVTLMTGVILTAVDIEFLFEVTRFAVLIEKIAEGGASLFNGFG